jgi:ADP-heptose:LPS heptosyltransferase/GT2 family glycosyltransferase
MRLFVSMIGLNRESGTKESVEAVLSCPEQFYLSLTNQNSSDGTGAYFDEVQKRHPERVFVFHEEQNTFFQPPNNRAYRMAVEKGCDYFLCLNDDAIIPKHGLSRMIEMLDGNPQISVVGSKGGCEELSPSFHGQPGKLEFVEGSCMMIRIAALRKHRHTLFWDQLQGIYSEDSEISLFLQEKGYQIAKADFDLPHARSSTVNRDAATQAACRAFQQRNHDLCVNRYAHWLKTRRWDFPIILKRKMAIGDVILTTPIIRAIKESNPLSDIYVETDFPEVFENNPLVAEAAPVISQKKDELVIDLNGSYEDTTMQHILEAYEATTRKALPGLGRVEWRTELHPSKKDLQWAQAMKAKMDGPKLCVLHGDPLHWPGKALSAQLLEHVASHLRKNGWKVALVGKQRRLSSIGNDRDFTGETTLLQTAAILKAADLFIGPDSGPLHVSQAAGCPSIGIFGVTSSRFILTHGSKSVGLDAPSSIPSAGLRHRRTGVTFLNEGKEAMDHHKAEDIFKAITQLGL